MARVLRTSKLVLKSILTLGDGWIQRLANNPLGELQMKVENKRCNLGKGRLIKKARRQ